MNTLEIFLMSVLAGSIFTLFVPPAKRMKWMHALPALAMLLVLLHLILDGYRWQVLPLYLLAAGLFLATFKNSYGLLVGVEDNRPGRDRRGLRIIGAVFSFLVLLTAGFIDHIFPMMLLPEPTGAYAVGTTTLYMNDTSRRELLSDDPEDIRELMVQVWYPAAGKGEGRRGAYIHPEIAKAYASHQGFPGFMSSHLAKVKTHYYQDAALAKNRPRFPVILFSHGLGVPVTFYASVLENLASQGYIIFGISHTYETPGVAFPDGRLAFYNTKAYDGYDWGKYANYSEEFKNTKDYAGRARIIHEANGFSIEANRAKAWAEDIHFVIDELVRINIEDPGQLFYARLDMEKLGILGHSYGGGAVGQAMVSDSRIKAGVNWDGIQWGDILDKGLDRPLMSLNATREEETHPFWVPNPYIFREARIDPLYFLEIEGTGHSNYSDIPLFVNLRPLNEAGTINPYRGIELVNTLTCSFFDKYLKGNGDFPALVDRLPEVKYYAMPGG
jgi:hypothetical protein